MPITIKSDVLKFKDGNQYVGVDVVAERTTSEQVAQATAAIESKGQDVLGSIPAEYDGLVDAVADGFSTTKTYAVGDMVFYNDELYKCTTAVTAAGTWTAANWTKAVVANEVSNLKNAIITQYKGNISGITDVRDLPTNTWISIPSQSIGNMLGPNFPAYEYLETNNLTMILSKQQITTSGFRYELYPYGSELKFTGYTAFNTDEVVWYDWTPDKTLSSTRRAASAHVVGDAIDYSRFLNYDLFRYGNLMVAYNPSNEIFDIVNDMPLNSVYYGYPSRFQDSLGSNFLWDLSRWSTTTLILEKHRFGFNNNKIRAYFRLYNVTMREQYYGYTIDGTTIYWLNWSSNSPNPYSYTYTWTEQHKDDFMLYSPDDFVVGWVLSSGAIDTEHDYPATDYLRVIPGKDYYFTDNPTFVSSAGTIGAFYDVEQRLVSTFRGDNLTYVEEYAYKLPNGYVSYDSSSSSNTKYIKMYVLHVPENAYWVKMNVNSGRKYNWSLCTKPMYAVTGNGNWTIPGSDQQYQMFNRRKLCVIGPSTTMIDRYNPNKNGFAQNIMGWQEYLVPWYGTVDSYGYSGASWGDDYTYGETNYSIHNMICGNAALGIDPVDLSQYDDFVLTSSTNGILQYDVGTWDKSDPSYSTGTYLGAFRDTIDYIYSQNGSARIMIGDMPDYESLSTSAKAKRDAINKGTYEMCEALGIRMLDFQNEGVNQHTMDYTTDGVFDRWSYDGVHYNQVGSKMLGMYYLRNIIGK